MIINIGVISTPKVDEQFSVAFQLWAFGLSISHIACVWNNTIAPPNNATTSEQPIATAIH